MPSYINTSFGRKYFTTVEASTAANYNWLSGDPSDTPLRNGAFMLPVKTIPNPPQPTSAGAGRPTYFDYSLKNGKKLAWRKRLEFRENPDGSSYWNVWVEFVIRGETYGDDEFIAGTQLPIASASNWNAALQTANAKYVIAIPLLTNSYSAFYPSTCSIIMSESSTENYSEYFESIFNDLKDGSRNLSTGGTITSPTIANRLTVALEGS